MGRLVRRYKLNWDGMSVGYKWVEDDPLPRERLALLLVGETVTICPENNWLRRLCRACLPRGAFKTRALLNV